MEHIRFGQWFTKLARRLEPGTDLGPMPSNAGSLDALFWRNVRTIARIRVLLALVNALVVYVDPTLPPRDAWYRVAAADGNIWLIIAYSLWVWRQEEAKIPPAYLPRLTTWLDVLFSATLIASTGGRQSPLYLWNLFTIASATLKFGWGTAVRVCAAELVLYLYVALYLPDLGRSDFIQFRFLIRTSYLFVIALVLAHMGQRLLEQTRMMASLHNAAAHMSAGRSTTDILGRAADSLTDLLEAERVAVAVWAEHSEGIRPIFINMSREQGERLLCLARDCVAALPRADVPLTLRSSALGRDVRFEGEGDALVGVRNLLITRLPGGRACPGVLVACNRMGKPAFTEADQDLAELLAAQVGPLLETALLQEQRRSYASGNERRRIAAELHDGLIQTLAGIGLRTLTCHNLWRDRRWEPLGEELEALTGLAVEAQEEARGAINELAPVHLREQGLTVYLEGCIRQFQERMSASLITTIDLDLEETGYHAERVPEPTALLLISLLHEGLNNIRKHARASRVTLTITRSGEEIVFRLADDGVGFCVEESSLQQTPTRHYGLAYLGERITRSGGEMQVISRPGEGTTLAARLPLLTEERLMLLLSQAQEMA